MKQTLNILPEEKVIALGSEIVYGQRAEWCDSTWRPLQMSLMRSRQHYPYDPLETLPVIVFLCGGSFTNVDRNVWMPELVWFAKRGYAIASVDYSVTARTRFPMQLEDVKLAIRYLRAHAAEYRIDPDRMLIMGESAGGYLAGLTALTSRRREFDVGDYQEYSSAVSGAVCFYTRAVPSEVVMDDPIASFTQPDRSKMFDLPPLVDENAPPFLLLHGTNDSLVHHRDSEALYEALQAKNIRSDLYLFENADHADAPFFQPAIKQIILEFADSLFM